VVRVVVTRVLAELFTTSAQRAAIEHDQQPLPLAYFTGSLAIPDGWDADLAAAYLAFGETYATERAAAERRCWPTRTLPGRHLHQVVAPGEVAEAIADLVELINTSRGTA
jgi:hypothetical protein